MSYSQAQGGFLASQSENGNMSQMYAALHSYTIGTAPLASEPICVNSLRAFNADHSHFKTT